MTLGQTSCAVQSQDQKSSYWTNMAARLLRFTAERCRPCHEIAEEVERLCADLGIPHQEVNVDHTSSKSLMVKYSISTVPVLIYEDNNRNATYRIHGADIQRIQAVLHQIASSVRLNQNSSLPQCQEAELEWQTP